MTLKNQALTGFGWSFLESSFNKLIQLVVGIYLARILTPEDFGLVGITFIIISLLQPLVDGGLSAALIQKQDCNEDHYSSAFFYGIFISVLLYGIIYFSSFHFAVFFNNEKVEKVIKILGLIILIAPFGTIPNTLLTKRLEFVKITRVSIISQIFSGLAGIIAAKNGYGLWSLVLKNLIQVFLYNVFLNYIIRWKPKLILSINKLKELLNFGLKLVLSSLINSIFGQTLNFLLAKFYSPIQLGFYSRAELIGGAISTTLSNTIEKVSFPVLSKIQNNDKALKNAFLKLIQTGMLFSFFITSIIYLEANDIINILLGEKWLVSVNYLQIICFAFVFHPLHSINLSILKVKAKISFYLRIEIIKKIILVPLLIIGSLFSIEAMLWAFVFHSIVSFLIHAHFTKIVIEISLWEQLKVLIFVFLLSISPIILAKLFFLNFDLNQTISLILEVTFASIIFLIISMLFKIEILVEIVNIIKNNLLKK